MSVHIPLRKCHAPCNSSVTGFHHMHAPASRFVGTQCLPQWVKVTSLESWERADSKYMKIYICSSRAFWVIFSFVLFKLTHESLQPPRHWHSVVGYQMKAQKFVKNIAVLKSRHVWVLRICISNDSKHGYCAQGTESASRRWRLVLTVVPVNSRTSVPAVFSLKIREIYHLAALVA